MLSLFEPDEDLVSTAPVIGYKILHLIDEKRSDKVSIFDIADKFKNETWFSLRKIQLALIFLYSLGIVDFQQPYIIKNVKT